MEDGCDVRFAVLFESGIPRSLVFQLGVVVVSCSDAGQVISLMGCQSLETQNIIVPVFAAQYCHDGMRLVYVPYHHRYPKVVPKPIKARISFLLLLMIVRIPSP
jgi:hypothetical protein